MDINQIVDPQIIKSLSFLIEDRSFFATKAPGVVRRAIEDACVLITQDNEMTSVDDCGENVTEFDLMESTGTHAIVSLAGCELADRGEDPQMLGEEAGNGGVVA